MSGHASKHGRGSMRSMRSGRQLCRQPPVSTRRVTARSTSPTMSEQSHLCRRCGEHLYARYHQELAKPAVDVQGFDSTNLCRAVWQNPLCSKDYDVIGLRALHGHCTGAAVCGGRGAQQTAVPGLRVFGLLGFLETESSVMHVRKLLSSLSSHQASF